MRVHQGAVGADNQHPRAVPRIRRGQRDALWRENEIEGVDAHRGHRRSVEAVNLWLEKERDDRLAVARSRRLIVPLIMSRKRRYGLSSESP